MRVPSLPRLNAFEVPGDNGDGGLLNPESGFPVLSQNESLATLLARLEGILGPMPPWMLRKGRYSHRFYTKAGCVYERTSSVSRHTGKDIHRAL